MPVKAEIRLDAKLMSDFMVYHIFSSTAGVAALVLAALNVGFAVSFILKGKYPMALVFVVFVFVIVYVFPRLIRRKVTRQMENSPLLTAPIIYEFDEEGVETTTHNDHGKASWEKFCKAVSHKNMIILYDGQRRSVILPVEQIGDGYEDIVALIEKHLPPKAVKIRGRRPKA